MSDQQIDLRGVKCPLNFVKTKLALEQLANGQVLEVILDADAESAINVPNSLRQEGHEIIGQTTENNLHTLHIKKAAPHSHS